MQKTSPDYKVIRSRIMRLAGGRRIGGFTLIVVLWVLALILLLGTAVTVGVRYRTRTDSSLLNFRRAELAAESAINFGILLQLSRGRADEPSFPLVCRMNGGEQVVLDLSEEAGKVDLNAASPQTLAKLFLALTGNQGEGERIARAILSHWGAGEISGQTQGVIPANRAALQRTMDATPVPPNRAVFRSVLELEDIAGVTPEIFRAALPLVTVRSGRLEPDSAVASAALRDALGLPTNPAKAAPGAPARDNGEITIRADIRIGENIRFIREALVSLRPENGRPFIIREWRHADAGGAPNDRANITSQPCFTTGPGQSQT